ncbi:ubiquinol cytochrome c reductase subunit qcr9 [Nannochloropsis gaditana]|uniref:Ubiquinol cytochrome c reductase subunit qcr9 n=1 Tax=Nannochloropsis gaditana TaxID=72520 RepID=W7U4G0_9STRA|nr:ubiquinol cytochrome c reductase subunit qcr9 [Nannochloropsis gaditana]
MLFSTAFRRMPVQRLAMAGNGRRGLATASPGGSGAFVHTLYRNVFRSNIAYLTYVFAGAIVVEWVYSKGIDTAWEISNRGKLFHQVDWTKWHFHLDEEEEEEEEEEEDE